MRDYAELIEALREADEKSMCGECGLNLHSGATKKGVLFADAADAIEELIRALNDCRNELCLQCGAFKQRHMGVCDGCRWLEPPTERSEDA